jgi:hypothetical protein
MQVLPVLAGVLRCPAGRAPMLVEGSLSLLRAFVVAGGRAQRALAAPPHPQQQQHLAPTASNLASQACAACECYL